MTCQYCSDFIQRNILFQFDGKCLTVTAHGTDSDTTPINRNGIVLSTDYLVGLRNTFPLFTGLTIFHGTIDPGNKACSKWHSEIIGWHRTIPKGLSNITVNVQNC